MEHMAAKLQIMDIFTKMDSGYTVFDILNAKMWTVFVEKKKASSMFSVKACLILS